MANIEKEFELLVHAKSPEAAKELAGKLLKISLDDVTINPKTSPNGCGKISPVDYGNGNYGFLFVLDHQKLRGAEEEASRIKKALKPNFDAALNVPARFSGAVREDDVASWSGSPQGSAHFSKAREAHYNGESFAVNPHELGYTVVKKIHPEQQIQIHFGAHSLKDASAFHEKIRNLQIDGKEGAVFEQPTFFERGNYQITLKIPGEPLDFEAQNALRQRIQALATETKTILPPDTTWEITAPSNANIGALRDTVATNITAMQESGALPKNLRPEYEIRDNPATVSVTFYAPIDDPKHTNSHTLSVPTGDAHYERIPLSRDPQTTQEAFENLQSRLANFSVSDRSQDDFAPRPSIKDRISFVPKELPYLDRASSTAVEAKDIPTFETLGQIINARISQEAAAFKKTFSISAPEPKKEQSSGGFFASVARFLGFGGNSTDNPLKNMRGAVQQDRAEEAKKGPPRP